MAQISDEAVHVRVKNLAAGVRVPTMAMPNNSPAVTLRPALTRHVVRMPSSAHDLTARNAVPRYKHGARDRVRSARSCHRSHHGANH